MARRGPDHAAARAFESPGGVCQLLHARLSIIDLDARSNQPFRIGHLSIVFNGELYNYREIRQELKDSGYQFKTGSDTEVLLAAILYLGWDVLDRCEGMWAFAVYDHTDDSLTLCRDRFGEKPLCYLQEQSAIFFASEPKAISAMRGRSLEIDTSHIQRFLVNGYKSLYKKTGRNFFRNLQEVPPGCTLRIGRGGEAELNRYWAPSCNIDDSMSYEDAVAGAREKLIRSVELRLRADVPVAFCMSGGVDSNSLISIARREFNYDVHGFTIVNSDERYEEQDIIEQTVAELGIRHTNIELKTSGFLPKLRDLVRYHDSPVSTVTYFAHSLLMEAVAEHGYRISVSGTAADELFTGYYDHHLLYLADIASDTSAHEQALAGWMQQVKPVVRNPFLSDPDLFRNDSDFRGHIYLGADKFAAKLTSPWNEEFAETTYTHHLLRNRMLNELFHEATPVILHEDDLNAMYYSIENRSPFLDRQLFDHCYSIPTRHLIRNGLAKIVLRDSMRGIVPDCVLDNPRKVGFNAPIFSFLDVHDPEVRACVLDDSPVFDIVRRQAIEDMMAQPQLPNSDSKFLFYFLSCKMFLEECTSQSGSPVQNAEVA